MTDRRGYMADNGQEGRGHREQDRKGGGMGQEEVTRSRYWTGGEVAQGEDGGQEGR